jgi:hypothetical protein
MVIKSVAEKHYCEGVFAIQSLDQCSIAACQKTFGDLTYVGWWLSKNDSGIPDYCGCQAAPFVAK